MDIEMESPTDDLETMVEAEDEYVAIAGAPRSSNDPTAC
jgi:hypothetical protein